MKKLREYRIALQELAKMPEVKTTALAVANLAVASAGWISAGRKQQKIDEMEAVDLITQNWRTIKVSPDMMEKLENGATLLYRQKRLDENNVYTQSSVSGKFSEKMDEEFETVSMEDVKKWEGMS